MFTFKKMIKDTEIKEKWDIPISTLQDWKKSQNWRINLYNALKNDELEDANAKSRFNLTKELEKDSKMINSLSFKSEALESALKAVEWEVSYQIKDIIINNLSFENNDYLELLALKHDNIIAKKIRELENE